MTQKYIWEIRNELSYNKERFNFSLETIYIGGGNPSADIDDISRINEFIYTSFDLKRIKEYTIESNPVNIDLRYIEKIKEMKINRISLGVQSFIKEALEVSNRKQSCNDVFHALELLNDNVGNISIDLINGLPNSKIDKELDILESLLNKYSNIKHISFYELSITKKSKFGKMKLPYLSDKQREIYESGFIELMNKSGFNQYEISNFSKSGYESMHNICYWKYENYAGLGPGAHGTIDGIRYENEEDIDLYINGEYRNIIKLTRKEQIKEFLLMGLRLNKGIDVRKFQQRFDMDIKEIIDLNSIKYENDFLFDGNILMMSGRGFRYMNQVLLNIFEDIDRIKE